MHRVILHSLIVHLFERERKENLSTDEQLTIIFVITSSDTMFFILRSLIVHLFERKKRKFVNWWRINSCSIFSFTSIRFLPECIIFEHILPICMLFECQRRENLSTDGELTRVISPDYVSYSNVFTYNVRTYSSNCACYFGHQRRENLSTDEQLTIFVITSSDTTFFILYSLIALIWTQEKRKFVNRWIINWNNFCDYIE